MSIVKNYKRKNRYSTIDSTGVLDESLSWKAKGLLWYILSKPDDWQIRMADLVKRSKDGRDATRRALTELEENRYAVRTRSHDEKGLFCWNTIVFDCAEAYEEWAETEEGRTALSSGKASRSNPTDQKTIDGLSIDGFSVDGLSVDGKPEVIYINDLTNIESTIIEKEKKKEILEPLSFFPSGKNEESEVQNNISSHAQTKNPNIQDPQTPKPLSPVPPENIGKPIKRSLSTEKSDRKLEINTLLADDEFRKFLFDRMKKDIPHYLDKSAAEYELHTEKYLAKAFRMDEDGDERIVIVRSYKKLYERYKAEQARIEEERSRWERDQQEEVDDGPRMSLEERKRLTEELKLKVKLNKLTA